MFPFYEVVVESIPERGRRTTSRGGTLECGYCRRDNEDLDAVEADCPRNNRFSRSSLGRKKSQRTNFRLEPTLGFPQKR